MSVLKVTACPVCQRYSESRLLGQEFLFRADVRRIGLSPLDRTFL